MNGSVNLLADAMQKVFTEFIESSNESVVALVGDIEEKIEKSIDEKHKDLVGRIVTTDQNMSDQFSRQQEYISSEIKRQLRK